MHVALRWLRVQVGVAVRGVDGVSVTLVLLLAQGQVIMSSDSS
jgi:hypothetical protein